VIRVSTLCRLYEEAFHNHDARSKEQLETLIKTARDRGYADGVKILLPSLSPDFVRKICWNVSSLLTQQDFLLVGVNTDG
jgi:hypothetical protein